MKKSFLALLTVVAAFVLFACGGTKTDNVELKVAVNFDGTRFISYNQDQPYTALNGKTYTKGDLSPTWSAIGENLGIDFVDRGIVLAKPNTDTQYKDALTDGFKDIDLINSTGANITNDRQHFVNLKPYIDGGKMPNLKKFLNSQSTYESYLTASDGGIYYTPYLDGNEEVELGYLIRLDWTQKILDTNATADAAMPSGYKGLENTKRFNPATLETTITVATEGAGKRVIKKEYDANIIDLLKAGDQTPAAYLATFRQYVADVTEGQGYAKKSDLFLGFDASYTTDELIALMAVVKANPKMLRGDSFDSVEVYFPREARGSRVRNFFRGMEMFGTRGAVSKNNWLYMDNDGKLTDARHEDSTIESLNRLNHLYDDQIIMQGFHNSGNNTNHRDTLLHEANGFLMYDYNATSTAQSIIDKAVTKDAAYNFQSILPPVNDWKGNGEYFHFTESVRSLKNEAWGITKQAASDPDKLAKAIELVDYLYETEPREGAEDAGGLLFLYGPKEWRHATETVTYQGEEIPKFSDGALAEIADPNRGKGNMINYLRDYVGATLPVGHVRSLGLELQTLSDQGKEGYERVYNAVAAGTYRLAGLYSGDDKGKWYNTVPNVFALTKPQENELKEARTLFDQYWGDNSLYLIVEQGITGDRLVAYKNLFKFNGNDWYGNYIKYYQAALDKILK